MENMLSKYEKLMSLKKSQKNSEFSKIFKYSYIACACCCAIAQFMYT